MVIFIMAAEGGSGGGGEALGTNVEREWAHQSTVFRLY